MWAKTYNRGERQAPAPMLRQQQCVVHRRFTLPSELPHDSTPVPSQATWLAKTTNNVQEDAARSSLRKSEFHKVSAGRVIRNGEARATNGFADLAVVSFIRCSLSIWFFVCWL